MMLSEVTSDRRIFVWCECCRCERSVNCVHLEEYWCELWRWDSPLRMSVRCKSSNRSSDGSGPSPSQPRGTSSKTGAILLYPPSCQAQGVLVQAPLSLYENQGTWEPGQMITQDLWRVDGSQTLCRWNLAASEASTVSLEQAFCLQSNFSAQYEDQSTGLCRTLSVSCVPRRLAAGLWAAVGRYDAVFHIQDCDAWWRILALRNCKISEITESHDRPAKNFKP